jgi:NAD(P)-dependent dehydrogenase (short-subunit alcohol dehydrogenase family)
MKQLKGRVAVVTGGASGIGYAMADRFAREGMRIVLADIQADALEEAEGRLRAGGAEVLAVETDVAQPAAVEHLRDRALGAFGAVHVVCNNAGVVARGSVWETTVEDWNWILGVNLWGVINGIRTFVPVLLEQEEGHVVNTASMAGVVAGLLNSYSVTKQAVVGLSESLYFGLQARGASNVGVSVLCPGWVRTQIADADRNRPAASGPPAEPSPLEASMTEMIRGLVESGSDPTEVAGQVLAAIQEQRFYVLTHPEMLGAVTARHEDILSGGPPRATLG